MTKAQTEVRFYRASEKPYGAFSNLYRREIEFEGETFASSEHAYQAGKARKPAIRKWLMDAPSPRCWPWQATASMSGTSTPTGRGPSSTG